MTAPILSTPSADPGGGSPLYDRMKRHEVEVLRRAGFSLRAVARKAGIARNTVKRILEETQLIEARRQPVGRPSIAAPFAALVEQILRERSCSAGGLRNR